MKRPAFQFYPSDWTSNSNLRRCTHAEKGVWLEIMCLMHDSEEYGLLRWPLKEIIEAVKCKPAEARALVSKGVLKGSDTRLDEPFVYTPRHGRKDGESVTLVQAQDGPVWFSSRMVKDEYVRTIRGDGTRFGDGNGDSPKAAPNSASKVAPNPPFGDGSSSSSSSSSSDEYQEPTVLVGKASPPRPPDCPTDDLIRLYHERLPMLPRVEVLNDSRRRALSARWREVVTDPDIRKASDPRAAALDWFDWFFGHAATSKFLTGRAKEWRADFDFLLTPSKFAKVVEGSYHKEAA